MVSAPVTASSQQTGSTSSRPSTSSKPSWIKQVRALPSNPSSNDFLKLEYIDINLNNSRKLIGNLDGLTETTGHYLNDLDLRVNGSMIQLHQINASLDWLD